MTLLKNSQQKVGVDKDGVSPEVAEKILTLQSRCVICGSTYALHIHHRVFRSEGDFILKKWLEEQLPICEKTRSRKLEPWTLHEIQNLVVLCQRCHEGDGVGVHGGNERLRMFLKSSFTCPKTGFNVTFKKPNSLI